jgi:hypothetical protein
LQLVSATLPQISVAKIRNERMILPHNMPLANNPR